MKKGLRKNSTRKSNKLFFLSFILLLSFESYCQKILFYDLKYLLEHDVESSDAYITKKGFKYYEAEKGKNGNCDSIIWSFNRNTYNNRADAFIAKYCFKANSGFIWYQFADRLAFDKIKENCKAIGYKLTNRETNPFDALCTTFESREFKIEFCSGLNEGTNRNSYTITLNLK